MCEKGNDKHRRIVQALQRNLSKWEPWYSQVSSDSRPIPPADMVQTEDFSPKALSLVSELDTNEAYLMDVVTGARLSSADSIAALYKFVARAHPSTAGLPLFEYAEVAGSFPAYQCRVALPNALGIDGIVGPVCRSKADARRLACYRTCQELHRLRVLASEDFPAPLFVRLSTEVPPEGSVPTELSSSANGREKDFGIGLYVTRRTAFWRRSLKAPPDRLYPSVLSLRSAHDGTPSPMHRPIALIARCPLPSFPPIAIRHKDEDYVACLQQCSEWPASQEQLVLLFQFTVELWRKFLGKPIEGELEKCGCFLVPLHFAWNENVPSDVSFPFPVIDTFVDWDNVRAIASSGDTIATTSLDPESDMSDAVIKDTDGLLYDVLKLRTDLTPLSQVTGKRVCIPTRVLLLAKVIWIRLKLITRVSSTSSKQHTKISPM